MTNKNSHENIINNNTQNTNVEVEKILLQISYRK